MQTNSTQPMTMAMPSASMDDNNRPCSIGCQQTMANDNDNSFKHSLQHQPVDLLALQQEIQQFTDIMQAFFDSLLASTGATMCSNNHNESNK